MGNLRKIMILGREHERTGEIYYQALDSSSVAFGMSVGVTGKPNEDAIGVAVLGSEMVLAIADGHWGRTASEIAVSRAVELLSPDLRPSRESETRARLLALYEQINNELYDLAMAAPGVSASETTLIVCHVKEVATGKYLYWSSFGDSYLFLLRDDQVKQLNSLNPFWLGYLSKLSEKTDSPSLLMRFLSEEARYVGVANGLETGIEKLEERDMVFLCTDGLVGFDRDPKPSVLEGIGDTLASDLPLVSKVEKMIGAALRRAEKDNISCIAAQI